MAADPQALLAKAEKTANSSQSFFSKIMSSSSFQLEDAADLYIQAANAFRINKDNQSAGQALEKAAELQKKTDSRDEAANTLVEAFKAYRQTDAVAAARVLSEGIHLFTLRGQFRRAAQYEMDLGALYETELENPKAAITAYENSGDWFLNDRAEALSSKAYLKVAELAALDGDYDKAVANFDKVAKQSLNSNLAKWSLKDYFFRAVFCVLAQGDAVSANIALDKYVDWDPTFGTTKEHDFLADMVEAVKDHDEQAFTDKLYAYDQFNKLDKWKVAMGLKIKQQLESEEEDLL